MRTRRLLLLVANLTLAAGCGSKAPPVEQGGSRFAMIKDQIAVTSTATETATVTHTATATQTGTQTRTATGTASTTSTQVITGTVTQTATGTATVTGTQTLTSTAAATGNTTGTASGTFTATIYYISPVTYSRTVTSTAYANGGGSVNGTASSTSVGTYASSTFTATGTMIATGTVSAWVSGTGTNTLTVAANQSTASKTVIRTSTATGTAIGTITYSQNQTGTATGTATVTNTGTATSVNTVTTTNSATTTGTVTATLTSTTTFTSTDTVTATITGASTSSGTSVQDGGSIDAPSGGAGTSIPCSALANAITAAVGSVTLTVNSGALVDSYSSSIGPYGGSNVASNGNVVAAGTITNNGGVINGQQSPNTPSTAPLPAVPPDAVNLPLGSSSPGNLYVNQASDSVTLAPGTYVVQNLNVNYPGAVNISPEGPVAIFVTGGLNLGGNENLNGLPANLVFIVTQSGLVNVNSNGQLFGGIYAPTSSVNINSAVYGFLVGGSVNLNSGAAVHYDQNQACACSVPTAPGSISVSSGPGQVALSWTVSAGATGYTVKRATSSGGPYATIASGIASAKYIDSDQPSPSLQYGATAYYYVISASNGCGDSEYSEEVSGNSAVLMPPRSLPPPPKEVGCYVGTPGGWQGVACTPPDQMDPIFLGPHIVSEPSIHSVPVAGKTVPFQFGQIDTTIVTYTPVEKSLNTNDSLTLQLNTNIFPGNGGISISGHQYVYQFVLLTHGISAVYPVAGTGICIEPVDRTVACEGYDAGQPCWNTAGYNFDNWCVGGVSGGSFNIGNLRGLQAFDFATLAVSTFSDNGVAKIGLVAQFSWFDPGHDQTSDGNGNGLYSVVTTDDFGLGLQGNWTSMSGTLIGLGGGASAVFEAPSSVLTRSLAGSCVIPGTGTFAGIPWPGACPNQPSFLPYTENAMDKITGETNNLTIVGSPSSLVSYEPDLVFTEYLASTDGNCQADNGVVYVKDSAEDTGVIPTNTGGQPFWESPDILFVLPGETVDENTTTSGSLISFGATYDFYVRVHNDLGCSEAKGVKARLFVADPSSLAQEWNSITGDGYSVGLGEPSGGVNVPARQAKMLGPFRWTAPQGTGSVHKCLLAAIESDKQAAPDGGNGALPEAYMSSQVAQRNVQFENCSWPLPATQAGNVNITLTTNGAQPQLAGSANHIQVTFDDPNGSWNAIWSAYASPSSYSSTYDGAGKTTVRLGTSYVVLHSVPITANATPVATVTMTQMQMTTSVVFNASLTPNGASSPIKQNGSTCTYNHEIIL